MGLEKKIKRRARQALRGRLSGAVALFLLWVLAWTAIDLADRASFRLLELRLDWRPENGALRPEALLATLAALGARLVLLTPLRAGAVTWFDGLVNRRQRPLKTLFWPYGNRVWLRSLGVRLYTGAVTGAVALLPLAALAGGLWLLRGRLAALTPERRALIAALSGTAAGGWLLAAWTFGKRFSAANFLLGPDYGCTAKEAVDLSIRCTRGHRWRLVWMDITFFPWFAACLLVIPAFYVIPYYAACRVEYSRYLYDRCRRRDAPGIPLSPSA